MHKKLRITRYNKTRNWAIWANEELMAVTVYRKSAQAVLDYIHTLTQNTINTMSKTKTTAAATTATNNNADFDPTIIKAVNGEGKTILIKFDPLGVSVGGLCLWPNMSSATMPPLSFQLFCNNYGRAQKKAAGSSRDSG